uniref:hypothetical protein n=1 Tax=Mitsuokella jalaludinii TaxID=187979 RepID=UPI003077E1DE
MDLKEIELSFNKNTLRNEDDVKIYFHSDIVKPILEEVNPSMVGQYHSEDILLSGGRTDATFQNISFEFKKPAYFKTTKGKHEALYGRNDRDHGLYDYIISNASIADSDDDEIIIKKLTSGIGVGFDGKTFIFSRFIPSTQRLEINTSKVSVAIPNPLNIKFFSEEKEFQPGLKRLV